MKTILIDAVDCFVSDKGEIFQDMYELLEKYPNKKIILTNAPDERFEQYGLNKVPYEIFSLKRNPMKTNPSYFKIMLDHFSLKNNEVVYFEHSFEAVESARSIGIVSYLYDQTRKDLVGLKAFLDSNL